MESGRHASSNFNLSVLAGWKSVEVASFIRWLETHLLCGFGIERNKLKSTKLHPQTWRDHGLHWEKQLSSWYVISMSLLSWHVLMSFTCWNGKCWTKHAIWAKWAVHNSTVDFHASTDYKWGHHHPPSDRNSKLVDCTKGNGLFNFCIRPLLCWTIFSTEIAISPFSFEFWSCVLWCDLSTFSWFLSWIKISPMGFWVMRQSMPS